VDGSWKDVEYQGHKQGPDHPVVNVRCEDARACTWLLKKEGKTYRLPTDHEWSLAVEIGDREDPAPARKVRT
jgi:formylglycine-generating enzyme